MSDTEFEYTSSFFRARLRRLWRKAGLIKGRSGRPGLSIAEVVRESRKRNRGVKIEQLELSILAYDEFVSWFLSLYSVILESISRKRIDDKHKDLFICHLVLISKITSDLLAIRTLCIEGFDVSAKTLLRSTVEYIDVLIIVTLDPSISDEFCKTDSHEKSNEFWNNYFRGGRRVNKARRMMRNAWMSRLKFEKYHDAVGFDNWLYDSRDVLAMSGHPSWLGGYFSSIVLGTDYSDNWMGIIGSKGEISTTTLMDAVKHIYKYLVLSDDMPFEIESIEGKILVYDASQELERHIMIGRDFLKVLFAAIFADPRGHSTFLKEIDVSTIFPDHNDESGGIS